MTALVSLAMTPILINGLGMEAFGIWVIVNSLAVYRDVLQFGMQTATPKYVAEHSARAEADGMRTVVATSFWILTVPALVVLLLGVGIAAAFPTLFGVPESLREPAQILVLIMVLDFAASVPASAFTGTMMGLQRFDLFNRTLIGVAVAQALAMIAALALGGGLVALGAAAASVSIAGQLWRYLIARRLLPGLRISPRHVDRGLVRRYTALSIWYWLEDIGYVITNRIDTIVVGLVIGVGAAGVYGVGQRLASALAQLAQPITSLFFPHSSELAARRDLAGIRRSVLAGTRLMVGVIAPLALALGLLAGPLIDAWVGSGYEAGAPVAALLAAAVFVWVIGETAIVMLLGMGVARAPAVIRLGEAAINLGLSVLLAHLIGLEGVAMATLTAGVAANLLVLVPYACKRLEIQINEFLRALLVANLPPAMAASAVGLLLLAADPSGLLAVTACAITIVLVYAAVFLGTGLNRGERRALHERIAGRSAIAEGRDRLE